MLKLFEICCFQCIEEPGKKNNVYRFFFSFSEKFVFFFYFIIVCVHICFCIIPLCKYLKKQQRGVSSSGAEITGCFELSKVVTGEQSGACTLIHRDTIPAR